MHSMRTILFLLFVFFHLNIVAQDSSGENNSSTTPQIVSHLVINNNTDTLNLINIRQRHNHSFLNLSGQAVVGSLLAAGFSIIPFGLAAGDAWNRADDEYNETILGIIFISSYLFGAAVGVHWVAKAENPDLSLWKTFGYSAIGGGFSTVLIAILAEKYTTLPSEGIVIAFLSPILSSMIYASFISDWPSEKHAISLQNKCLSQKDLIEQSQLFDLELIRINF